MLKSGHEDMGVKEFIEYTKNSLSYEGYNHNNYILVRACEIMKEQEEQLLALKQVLRMVRKSQNDVTSHLVGEKHV